MMVTYLGEKQKYEKKTEKQDNNQKRWSRKACSEGTMCVVRLERNSINPKICI